MTFAAGGSVRSCFGGQDLLLRRTGFVFPFFCTIFTYQNSQDLLLRRTFFFGCPFFNFFIYQEILHRRAERDTQRDCLQTFSTEEQALYSKGLY